MAVEALVEAQANRRMEALTLEEIEARDSSRGGGRAVSLSMSPDYKGGGVTLDY